MTNVEARMTKECRMTKQESLVSQPSFVIRASSFHSSLPSSFPLHSCFVLRHSLIRHDPRVLASAALRRVHDKRALAQGHPRQPAGEHVDIVAVDDVRSQIDMPPL